MATSVLGPGPLVFMNLDGRQVAIPLSALSFDTNGNLTVDFTKSPYKSYPQALITSLLAHYAAEGLIVAAPVPAPNPALVITAVDPGAAGNNITVGFKVTPDKSNDPTLTTIDVTVVETDSYIGANALTIDSIESVLGKDKTSGSGPGPGLVHVVDGTVHAGTLPDATKSPFSLKLTQPFPNARVDVPTAAPGSGVAFTLEAKNPGKAGELTSVTIANVDMIKKTFELTVTWTKKVPGYHLATLGQIGTDFAYVISIQPPISGVFLIPADTGVKPIPLSGGVGGPSPVAASATIFASR
jgi:hypothetical protein